jgi:hypothetical protein
MLRKTTVALAAVLAMGSAFIATDAFAARAGVHAGGQRGNVGHVGRHYVAAGHRNVGYRGYGPGYVGYSNPGYGYYGSYGSGPCLPVPVPVVGCW